MTIDIWIKELMSVEEKSRDLTDFITKFDSTKQRIKYILDKYEQEQIAQIRKNLKPQFEKAYLLCSQPIYLVQWFLPILAVYPLPVVVIDHPETLEVYNYFISLGFSKDTFIIVNAEVYMYFLENVDKNVYCINCGCPTTLPNLGELKISKFYGSISFSHGCDEDEVYRDKIILPQNKPLQNKYHAKYDYSRWFNRFHTSFCKPTIALQKYTINDIKKQLNLNQNKKTVLIVETNHPWGWCFINKRFAYEPVRKQMEDNIIKLSDHYNVILRLHPMDFMSHDYYHNVFNTTKKRVHIVRTQTYPQFTPFIQMADVIIGSPNGVVCTAMCCIPNKPIVELIPHKNWSGSVDFDELRKENGDLMINSKHVVVQYENNINLVEKVSEAFATIGTKIEARKKYISTWYTPIDKYTHLLQIKDIFHQYKS